MIKHPTFYKDSATTPMCSAESWCEALGEQLHPEANADRKGMGVFLTFDFSQREPLDRPKAHGIYYLDKPKTRPIMFKFCPFCGGDLTFNWEKEDANS